jgi:hypothetical protein
LFVTTRFYDHAPRHRFSERTIWITDAHRGDGKRFVVRADEKLTAFVELEAACAGGKSASQAVAGQGGKCRSTLAGYL